MDRTTEQQVAEKHSMREIRVLLIALTVGEAIVWHDKRSDLFRMPGLDVSCIGVENLEALSKFISESDPFHLIVFDECIEVDTIAQVLQDIPSETAILQREDSFAQVRLDADGELEIVSLGISSTPDDGPFPVSPVLQLLRNAFSLC